MTEQHADKTYQRKSGHPESNQGPSDVCRIYSQMLYQLSCSRSWQSLWHGIGEHPFCPWGIVVKILQVLWVSGLSVEETSRRMLQGGTQCNKCIGQANHRKIHGLEPERGPQGQSRTRARGPEDQSQQQSRKCYKTAAPGSHQEKHQREPANAPFVFWGIIVKNLKVFWISFLSI